MDIKAVLKKFLEIYGGTEEDVKTFFAPGRVNLIGEHTDYNGGHVFPCALTLGTYGAVRKRSDRRLRFFSLNFEKSGIYENSLDELEPVLGKSRRWSAYPEGVIWTFMQKGYEIPCGLDIAVAGDIPNGSGLSSSASLEVLTGIMVRDTFGFKDVTDVDLALFGQYGENNYNGMQCGIMDQFASAMGRKDHAIFLDTNTLKYDYAPLQLGSASIVIVNSKVKHSLIGSPYNDRRNECAKALKTFKKAVDINSLGDMSTDQFETYKDLLGVGSVVERRARHAVYENQRTIQAVSALRANDIARFGKLMNASHDSLRDDYEVSCEEIDLLVRLAREVKGVYGSRITGGGFGGCTVSIVENEAIDAFKEHVGSIYTEKTGIEAEFYVVSAGDGVRAV